MAPGGSRAASRAGAHLLLSRKMLLDRSRRRLQHGGFVAVVDGFDVDMGTVGEALRLRELVDLAYDGLAKLLQGERDDAAAKARAAACERRVVGDGAHSDPWATRLPSNARPAAVAHL